MVSAISHFFPKRGDNKFTYYRIFLSCYIKIRVCAYACVCLTFYTLGGEHIRLSTACCTKTMTSMVITGAPHKIRESIKLTILDKYIKKYFFIWICKESHKSDVAPIECVISIRLCGRLKAHDSHLVPYHWAMWPVSNPTKWEEICYIYTTWRTHTFNRHVHQLDS